MGVEKSSGNLLGDDFNRVKIQTASMFKDFGKGATFHICHCNKKLVSLLSKIKNLHQVLMIQLFHRLRFHVEAFNGFLVRRGVKDFKGDFSFQIFLQSLIHIAHATFSENA